MSEEPIEHGKVLGPPKNLTSGLIKAVRPRQWVKNVLVLAAPLAAGNITDVSVLGSAGIAFVAFCLAASSIYLVNDAMDVEADRAHPTKRNRPIAAGVLPVSLAYVLAVVFLSAAIGLSFLASWQLAVVMGVYIAVQLAYCFGLKHQAVLDICIVSSGFLIRAIAGGVATLLDGDWAKYFDVGAQYSSATGKAFFDSAGGTYQGMINQVEAAYEANRQLLPRVSPELVAEIEVGADTYNFASRLNGQPTAAVDLGVVGRGAGLVVDRDGPRGVEAGHDVGRCAAGRGRRGCTRRRRAGPGGTTVRRLPRAADQQGCRRGERGGTGNSPAVHDLTLPAGLA